MTTKLAYLALIFIWSTTPLAMKWSTEGPGYLLALGARLALGLFVVLFLIGLSSRSLPWHRRAVQTYLAGGLGIYFAMGSIYWGTQFIPSGWVSVVFGLSPIITGALASIVLKESALEPHKITGLILAVLGLAIIFARGAELGGDFLLGVFAVLFGTTSHAISAVRVKQLDASVGGSAITAGSLIVAVPLVALTFAMLDGEAPATISWRAGMAIVYLGIVASAVGFTLYYFVLARMSVSRVSLIALITPVIALLLGNLLNGEPISASIIFGTAAITTGLVIYQFGALVYPRNRAARAQQ